MDNRDIKNTKETKLTEIQKKSVELLRVFTNLCSKEGLKYYLTGGALLGLIRQGGFIPWDDDIDIVMPRDDYERLVSLPKDKLPEGYLICDRKNNEDWHFAFCQFTDQKVTVEVCNTDIPRKTNFWLDVFPIDGLPKGRIARFFHVKQIILLRYLVQAVYASTQIGNDKKRSNVEKMAIKLCKKLRLANVLNASTILERIEITSKSYSIDHSNWCANMLGKYREREVVQWAWFGEGKQALFEGVEINIPEKSEKILERLYGDYMVFPKIEDQKPSHDIRILECEKK